MSMPALLSHFGINAARFVTTTGEVLFDGVTATSSGGFAHATHGAVTPVAEHTFHGGEEEPDHAPDSPTAWWDDDEIDRHIDAMKQAFPSFIYVPAEDNLSPCWIGEINTGRGKFRIGVILRHDQGLPTVAVINGPPLGVNAGRRWIHSPHLYLNGNLCVADRDDWNPDGHTAATATAWAAHWLAAYTEWRFRRRWPVEGVQSVAS